MRRGIRWLMLALLALTAVSAAAQEPTPEPMAEQMAAWEELSKPGEEHARLEPMIGEWEQTVTFWMAPGTEPVVSSSTSEAAWSLDGRWVEEQITGTVMGQPFRGHSMTGYDKFNDQYVSVWFDNMSTAPMVSSGTWDTTTNTLEMSGTMDDPMTGKADQPVRSVTHWKDADTVVMEMYAPGPDGAEFKSMEVESRRVGAPGGQ